MGPPRDRNDLRAGPGAFVCRGDPMAERPPDPELERSTNCAMAWGFVVMVLMVLVFPVYRFYVPSNRDRIVRRR